MSQPVHGRYLHSIIYLLLLLNQATLNLGRTKGSMDLVDRIADICTGHRAASWSPIQNLPGVFGSRTEVGTSHETDMTGRPSPGGQGSKSAAQMAPRCGCLHGVGGTARTTDPRACSSVTMTLAICQGR